MSREVPLVPGQPFLGSLKELREDVLAAYLKAQSTVGDVVRFQAGPPGMRTEVYGAFSPEAVRQILAGQAPAFRKDNPTYTEIRETVGNGLLTSQDAEYAFQRRMVQPLFTPKRVGGYASVVHAEAMRTLDAWKTAPEATTDVGADTAEFALRVVGRVLFGTDTDTAADVIRRCFPVIGESVLRRGLSPVRVPRTWPTPANRRTEAARRELYAVCDAIIERRIAAGEREEREDMISLLLRARDEDGAALDADAVRDQILIFLLAGHETTATTLAYALHLLAAHPEVQAAARAEVDAVLGDRPAGAADLDALPLLGRIVKETTRLYPAVAIMGRRCVTDTEVDGHRIPAGADVYVTPWVTHRRPDLWERPEEFHPDHFLPEAEATRPRHAWFPFGAGPRACVGARFSTLEITVALATVLRHTALHAVAPAGAPLPPADLGMALRPAGPLRIRTTARTQEAAA
ncbi:cytochrome P450 [Streptomyces sp. BI20]|uniref:cytochrome P450 n=1 Tax=Streptomyces sp. BI20 TaxID=3403460 RepID=UPI003C7290B5